MESNTPSGTGVNLLGMFSRNSSKNKEKSRASVNGPNTNGVKASSQDSGQSNHAYMTKESMPKELSSDIASGTIFNAEEQTGTISEEENNCRFEEEEIFLSSIEDGKISVFMDMLYRSEELHLNLNCKDANGESALRLAIAKGYSGIVELMLKHGAHAGDALLRAVDVGFVETVKKICDYAAGQETSEARLAILDCHCEDDDYHPDITPIVLAAQQNDFTIVKILGDAGVKIHVFDSKKKKQNSSAATDDLQKSVGSLEIYKGLASEAYLTQVNEDPVETSFKLSKKLRQLGQKDVEFKPSYIELADNVDQVGTELISHARNTEEILTVLTYHENHVNGKDEDDGKLGLLPKISRAIDFEQKSFVAHPNCQQAILAKFYGRLAYLRDKSTAYRLLFFLSVLLGFPFLSLVYLYVPKDAVKNYLACPYIKFVLKMASDVFFVVLLTADTVLDQGVSDDISLQRPTKAILLVWILGIGWREIKCMQRQGVQVLTQASHWRDIILVVLFLLGIAFDIAGYYNINIAEEMTSEARRDTYSMSSYTDVQVNQQSERSTYYILPSNISNTVSFQEPVILHRVARQARRPSVNPDGSATIRNTTNEEFIKFVSYSWWHPKLIATTMFAMSAVISLLRMLPYVVVSDVIGPLQISLSSMVAQSAHFFLVVALVIFAFAVGMTYIYSYYDQIKAYTCVGDTTGVCEEGRFTNVFFGIVYLYWSALGFEDQEPLKLSNQAQVAEVTGLVLYALFYILMVIVLLNALIAVMSEVYNAVEENADVEWKFHSTVMWMSILLDDDVVPPPFNLLPSAENIKQVFSKCRNFRKNKPSGNGATSKKNKTKMKENGRRNQDDNSQYKRIIHKLVERYVMAKTAGEINVNADVTITDILGLRNDLQSLKLELFQKLFETKHQIDKTTDEGSTIRDTSIVAKSVLHKTEEIHNNVDTELLRSILNFKTSVEEQKASIKERLEEQAKRSSGIFSQLAESYEAAKARIGFSGESSNDINATGNVTKPSTAEGDNSIPARKDTGATDGSNRQKTTEEPEGSVNKSLGKSRAKGPREKPKYNFKKS